MEVANLLCTRAAALCVPGAAAHVAQVAQLSLRLRSTLVVAALMLSLHTQEAPPVLPQPLGPVTAAGVTCVMHVVW